MLIIVLKMYPICQDLIKENNKNQELDLYKIFIMIKKKYPSNM